MVEEIFYQSSLPRAGSTLFQNIMAQNPDIYATPTSGLLELLYGARGNYTHDPAFKAVLEEDKGKFKRAFLAFCKSGMDAYCNEMTDKKYILDKSRSWGVYYDFLKMVRGENAQPKVIVMVRDLRDVFCSMEKKFRLNPDKAETTRDWATMRGATIPERVDIWSNTPPVGLALKRLQEIISFGNDTHMLFIRYEDLCLNPEQTMNRVYNYLGIPHFNHNFDFIEQVTHEDDTIHGEYGDHTIRNRLEMLPSDSNRILGEGVNQWIIKNYMWFFRYFNYIPNEPVDLRKY